jgi:sodium-dependent phosphate cotransporter
MQLFKFITMVFFLNLGTHLFVGAGLPSDYEVQEDWPYLNMPDEAVGIIIVCLSLFGLCACLIGMVKILSSLLQGSVLKTVRKSVNADFPCGRFGKELAGYVAILLGIGLTILVQSSSVFTAALNPLAGMGIVAMDRVYPLTVGAGIGTTITSILAAFTSDPLTIRNALQCAFAHFFFNFTGFLLYYPLPFMRKIPMYCSMNLGNITADYKWFAIFFLLMTYFVIPLVMLALSIPGLVVFACVMGPVLLLLLIIVIINRMQTKCPSKLPNKLQTWDWCPLACHSLEPYDKVVIKICPCKMCKDTEPPEANALDAIVMDVISNKNTSSSPNVNDSNNINQNNSNSLFDNVNEVHSSDTTFTISN